MKCPFKFGNYDFEGAENCIGEECGMHKLCGANDTLAAENDVSVASVDANDRNELQARVDELTSELTAARNAHAQAEHEAVILREKLGRMLDNAHEITRIGGDC